MFMFGMRCVRCDHEIIRRRDALGARAATTFNSVIVVWYLRPGAFSAASLAKSSPDHRHVTVLPARSN
jgi:hypothetical protein